MDGSAKWFCRACGPTNRVIDVGIGVQCLACVSVHLRGCPTLRQSSPTLASFRTPADYGNFGFSQPPSPDGVA